MNYYPHHIGDYSAATAHLTWVEDMAYTRLIRLYYQSERPIPTDMRQVYRLVRASSDVEREAVDTILAEFFTRTEDGFHQKRCDEEIERMQCKSSKARESAAKRWQCDGNANAMRTHAEPNANASESVCVGNAPNNQEPITKEELPTTSGVPPSLPVDEIFGPGLDLLRAKGCDEKGARSFLGMLRKKHGDTVVCEAIAVARSEDVCDPIPWIRKACEAKALPQKTRFAPEQDFRKVDYSAPKGF